MIFKTIYNYSAVHVISLVLLAILMGIGFRYEANRVSNKTLAPLSKADQIQKSIENIPVTIDSSRIESINYFIDIISKKKEHHKIAYQTLYKHHFTSITQFTIWSILTGIIAFWIAQSGWKEIKIKFRIIFLTMVVITTFYGLSMSVYKQNEGIQKNVDSYINYDNIQRELILFSVTEPGTDIDGNMKSFNEFLSEMVRKINFNNTIHLEFDPDAVNSTKYLDQYQGN